MRRIAILITTLALTMSGLAIVPAQAKAKVTKPSAPTVSALSSSTPKKGKVNVTITITLPASDGGSKITGSRVTAGGKSCTIKKTKTSCTIKSIKHEKALTVTAKSKNKKGFGPASTSVAYTAGATAWPTTPVTNVVADTSASAGPAPVAAPAPLTCATGGTCVVGDRGPGGGIVYFVSATTFTSTGSNCNTSCRYLEVAPATWLTGAVANDLTRSWSFNQISATGQNTSTASNEGFRPDLEKVNWKIGQGFNNTRVMNVGATNSPAKDYVLGYAGADNSTAGQWFIPSMNELNELCKYARGQTTGNLTVQCNTTGTLKTGTTNDLGGFVNDSYFSSSEYDISNALGVDFTGDTFFYTPKFNDFFIRPVRAF